MPVEYRLDVKTASGALVAQVTDMLTLSIAEQVNAPGLGDWSVNQAHQVVPLISDKYQVEVWRRWKEKGIAWYREFDSIYRDEEQETDTDSARHFAARCYGPLHILGWRENSYVTEVANKTKWAGKPPETICKDIVRNNLTSTGTTGAGRDRNATSGGTINGFTVTVEMDAARGISQDYQKARNEVLRDLQDIQAANVSSAQPFDFDLVKTGSATYQFRYYPGQRGTDRTASVVFSEAYDNMRHPVLRKMRSEEHTAFVVGGQGQKGERVIRTRTGANFSTTNDIEAFVDGRNSSTNAALDALGDKEATKQRMRPHISYEVVQNGAKLYGRDYFLGDLVTARYAGLTFVQQVYRVSLVWQPTGKEDVRIEMRDI